MASKIPQEVWTKIAIYLPPMSAQNASKVFGFGLTDRQVEEVKYENVWHSIFHKDTWLQRLASEGYTTAVIGYDLYKLYYYENGEDGLKKDVTCYLLMTVAPPPYCKNNGLDPNNYALLLECLQPHAKNEDTITISGSPTIILNIHDLRVGDGDIRSPVVEVSFLPRLFNCNITPVESAYILWEDAEQTFRAFEWKMIEFGMDKSCYIGRGNLKRTFNTIESKRIIGIGVDKTHESVSIVCQLCLPAIWGEKESWVIILQVQGDDYFDPVYVDGVVTQLEQVE